MRIPTLVALGVVAAAALGPGPGAFAAATADRWVLTHDFDYVAGAGPCIDEPLHFVGTLTSALRVVETPSGNFLSAGHTHAHPTATGTVTGRTYQVVDIREITTNVDASGGRQGIGAWAFMVVGPGPGNNLRGADRALPR